MYQQFTQKCSKPWAAINVQQPSIHFHFSDFGFKASIMYTKENRCLQSAKIICGFNRVHSLRPEYTRNDQINVIGTAYGIAIYVRHL